MLPLSPIAERSPSPGIAPSKSVIAAPLSASRPLKENGSFFSQEQRRRKSTGSIKNSIESEPMSDCELPGLSKTSDVSSFYASSTIKDTEEIQPGSENFVEQLAVIVTSSSTKDYAAATPPSTSNVVSDIVVPADELLGRSYSADFSSSDSISINLVSVDSRKQNTTAKFRLKKPPLIQLPSIGPFQMPLYSRATPDSSGRNQSRHHVSPEFTWNTIQDQIVAGRRVAEKLLSTRRFEYDDFFGKSPSTHDNVGGLLIDFLGFSFYL